MNSPQRANITLEAAQMHGSWSYGAVDYVTVTSSYYVVAALAQVLALSRRSIFPLRYHALCMDPEAYKVMSGLESYGVRATYIEDFEDDVLRICKRDKTVAEYCWSVKAPFLLALLNSDQYIGGATFLDADIYPFAGDGTLWEQLAECDIMLYPHRFPAELMFLDAAAGYYNAGMASFKNSPSARKALAWWRDRNLEWCYHRDEDGKLGDQKYLLKFNQLFEGVEDCKDKGINVGPWSVGNYHPYLEQGQVYLKQGVRLGMYHFHQYRLNPDNSYIAASDCYKIEPAVRELIYEPFNEAMIEALGLVREILPSFEQPH